MTAEQYQAVTILRSLLTPVEIESLRTWRDTRRHPVARLIFPREEDLAVMANMGWALGRVMDVDPQWLRNQKARLVATDDYANVSAVLSEIRAYGFILNAGLAIGPGPRASGPDFFIEERGERRVRVEVYSKQWDLGEVMALREFQREGSRVKPGEGVTARVHLTTPFGGPTDRDNVTVNAIHKLTQIKQREKQFSATETSILWLDFQDESCGTCFSVSLTRCL